MVHSLDGFHLICSDKGERLVESLQKFIAETKYDGAWLTGIGSAQSAIYLRLTNSDFKSASGYVKDLVAASKVDVFASRAYRPIYRKTDQAVGLKVLGPRHD